MQFQADLLGVPVERPDVVDTTAMGAGALAGIAAGVWPDAEAFIASRQYTRFSPGEGSRAARAALSGWHRAVRATVGLGAGRGVTPCSAYARARPANRTDRAASERRMTALGELSLWIALLMASWCAALAAQGALMHRPALTESGARGLVAAFVFAALAAAGLMAAFFGDDYALRYVAMHSGANVAALLSVLRVLVGTGRRAAACVADAGGGRVRRRAGDAPARRGPHAGRVDGGRARRGRRGGAGGDGVRREPVRAPAAPRGRRARARSGAPPSRRCSWKCR